MDKFSDIVREYGTPQERHIIQLWQILTKPILDALIDCWKDDIAIKERRYSNDDLRKLEMGQELDNVYQISIKRIFTRWVDENE